MPVETVTAEEGAAYGAALLAGVGAGVWPTVDEACDAVVHTRRRHHACRRRGCRHEHGEYRAVPARLSGAPRHVSRGDLMADAYHAPPRAQVLVRSLDRLQSRPRSVRRRRPAGAPAGRRRRRCSARSARGASTCTTTISCRSTPRPPSAIASSRTSRRRARQHGIVVPMATVSLFFDPVFRDGAFTANDPRVRAFAVQKTMRAMDLGAELGAKIFVLWGGREGTETDACRRPDEAVKRLREADQLPVRVLDRPEVRLQVRARGEAERAARRHLHGDDGRLPRASSRRSRIPRWSA